MKVSDWARWIVRVGGLGLCLFGIVRVFQGVGIMLEGKPTGASLIMAFGVVSFVTGLVVFAASFLFSAKRQKPSEKSSATNHSDSA